VKAAANDREAGLNTTASWVVEMVAGKLPHKPDPRPSK